MKSDRLPKINTRLARELNGRATCAWDALQSLDMRTTREETAVSNRIRLDPAERRHSSILRDMLFLSFQWRDDAAPHDMETVLRRPEAVRFWADFGRAGDFGWIASRDGVAVGAAWCRLLSAADHGYSFIDEETPCIAIAVARSERNKGIGGQLLEALAARARELGHTRIALAVEIDNPAVRLYERHGFVRDQEFEGYVRMVMQLR
jgi:GNAT superfamily N-acetyltransferase